MEKTLSFPPACPVGRLVGNLSFPHSGGFDVAKKRDCGQGTLSVPSRNDRIKCLCGFTNDRISKGI
ncbi:MAG: hypothetical protein AAB089_00100 [Nitrospirota bacterium]